MVPIISDFVLHDALAMGNVTCGLTMTPSDDSLMIALSRPVIMSS